MTFNAHIYRQSSFNSMKCVESTHGNGDAYCKIHLVESRVVQVDNVSYFLGIRQAGELSFRGSIKVTFHSVFESIFRYASFDKMHEDIRIYLEKKTFRDCFRENT